MIKIRLKMSNESTIVWIGVSQKENPTAVVGFLSLPVNTYIVQIIAVSSNGKEIPLNGPTISTAGSNTWIEMKVPILLLPGDYQIQTEGADILGLIVQIDRSSRVDNYQIYQAISALTRALGYQPSHLLKQINKSALETEPIHRKVRADLKKEVNLLDTSIKDLALQLSRNDEKSAHVIVQENPEHLSRIKHLEGVVRELTDKLQESEDYIENQMVLLKKLGIQFV